MTPFVATHPGEMIKDELKERGMTQKQLATATNIKPSVLSETINGKRSVSICEFRFVNCLSFVNPSSFEPHLICYYYCLGV